MVVFLRMCHHAASVLVLTVLRGGCGEKVVQMILPYSPAGLPAVGILDQGEQLLGWVEVPLVDLGDHLLAGRHSCHQDVSVLLEPVPVDGRASHSVFRRHRVSSGLHGPRCAICTSRVSLPALP